GGLATRPGAGLQPARRIRSCPTMKLSGECWRGTHECVRHVEAMLLASAIAAAVACAPCHPRIVQQFEQSRMAHSFAKASSLPSGALPAGRYDHRLSQRNYEIVRRQSADWLIRRSEAGDVERRIDFVVGSGAHARSFLTNPGLTRSAQGRLMELP